MPWWHSQTSYEDPFKRIIYYLVNPSNLVKTEKNSSTYYTTTRDQSVHSVQSVQRSNSPLRGENAQSNAQAMPGRASFELIGTFYFPPHPPSFSRCRDMHLNIYLQDNFLKPWDISHIIVLSSKLRFFALHWSWLSTIFIEHVKFSCFGAGTASTVFPALNISSAA